MQLFEALDTNKQISATSNGTKEGIDNRFGGLCENKHMKLKFEVHSGMFRIKSKTASSSVPKI